MTDVGSKRDRRSDLGRDNDMSSNSGTVPDPIDYVDAEEGQPGAARVDLESIATLTRPKKRQANPSTWVRNQRRRKAFPEVTSCGCSRKCSERIEPGQIQSMRAAFGSMNWQQQQEYLCGHMTRTRSSKGKLRVLYNVEHTIGTINVCRKMFMIVFNIFDKRLVSIRKRFTDPNFSGQMKPSTRGMHGKQRKVDPIVLGKMQAFIEGVVHSEGTPSHYCRAHCSSPVIYLPSSGSERALYDRFLRHEFPEWWAYQSAQQSGSPSDQPVVQLPMKQKTFFAHFAKQFGYIRFRRAKTDQCETCAVLEEDLNDAKARNDLENVVKLQNTLESHRAIAAFGYTMMRHDQEISMEPNPDSMQTWTTMTYDFERTLYVPNLPLKKARFVDQLGVFIFDIHCPWCPTCDHHCYVWNECEGLRGPDEVISTLENELSAALPPSRRGGGLILISDNCRGQNKNQYVMMWAHEHTLRGGRHYTHRRVDLKFPVVGHTFLSCDRFFSKVDVQFRKRKVYVPEEVAEVISDAFTVGHKPRVSNVSYPNFYTWKEYLGRKYTVLNRKDIGAYRGQPIKFEKVRWFSFGETDGVYHPGELWYRYSFSKNEPWGKIRIDKGEGELGILKRKYEGPVMLNAIKMQSLHDLARAIPSKYRHRFPAPDTVLLHGARAAVARKTQARKNLPALAT